MGENSLTIGGFNISGIVVAVGIPVLSAVGGVVWYAADVLGRFLDTEAAIEAVLAVESRVQAVEQTVSSNGVSELGQKLSSISTQMQTILEQQAQLLDLRNKVERASTITDGLGTDLKDMQTDIDNIWEAYDAFYKEFKENPIR
jgi:hypothetical protein